MSPDRAMIGYLQSRIAELEAELTRARSETQRWKIMRNAQVDRAEKAEAEVDKWEIAYWQADDYARKAEANVAEEKRLADAAWKEHARLVAEIDRLTNLLHELGKRTADKVIDRIFGVNPSGDTLGGGGRESGESQAQREHRTGRQNPGASAAAEPAASLLERAKAEGDAYEAIMKARKERAG